MPCPARRWTPAFCTVWPASCCNSSASPSKPIRWVVCRCWACWKAVCSSSTASSSSMPPTTSCPVPQARIPCCRTHGQQEGPQPFCGAAHLGARAAHRGHPQAGHAAAGCGHLCRGPHAAPRAVPEAQPGLAGCHAGLSGRAHLSHGPGYLSALPAVLRLETSVPLPARPGGQRKRRSGRSGLRAARRAAAALPSVSRQAGGCGDLRHGRHACRTAAPDGKTRPADPAAARQSDDVLHGGPAPSGGISLQPAGNHHPGTGISPDPGHHLQRPGIYLQGTPGQTGQA